MTDAEDTFKKERSAAQLEALSKARVKAAEVRAKNTELRKKEREVVNAQLAENRRLREESIVCVCVITVPDVLLHAKTPGPRPRRRRRA